MHHTNTGTCLSHDWLIKGQLEYHKHTYAFLTKYQIK